MVAPEAKIIPIRVLDSNGIGNGWSIIQGLQFAANYDDDNNPNTPNGVHVINLSFATPNEMRPLHDLLENISTVSPAPNRIAAVVVAAAGNNSSNTRYYPSAELSVDGKIAVTSTGINDTLSPFSNFDLAIRGNDGCGGGGGNNENDWIKLAAPGERIVSAIPGGRYGVWNGTSMAAPIVSGVAALVRNHYPTANVEMVADHLEKNTNCQASSVLIGGVGSTVRSRVDALNAVTFPMQTIVTEAN
jgi:subtilisin family serine protease